MALIDCPECSTKVSEKAVSCPSCGCPIAKPRVADAPSTPPPVAAAAAPVTVTKSRGTHIILGILFGPLGFHNFYAGHNTRGGIKIGLLLVTFILDASTGFHTGFSVVLLVIFALWSLFEIIFVDSDSVGRRMT